MTPKRTSGATRAGTRAVLALALGLGAACGEPDEEAPRPNEPTGEHAEDGLHAPLGARAVECRGASIDPSGAIDRLTAQARAGDPEGAIVGLEALAGAHPGSATTRVRLGELLMTTEPPRPERAARWFDLALAAHDRGCTLASASHWTALEGAAVTRMMQGDYRGAIRFMDASLVLWPGARHTRYNLACALCQIGDVDRCAEELREALRTGTVPPFLAAQTYPVEHYRDAARTDPDLAPLRAERARFDAILAAAAP